MQPLGFADRGVHGHRNRFRRVNLELAALADLYPDVHLVDVAAALNGEGAVRLLDDGLVGFSHFGSPGWMLQRPAGRTRGPCTACFPTLRRWPPRSMAIPTAREAATARAHMDALTVILGAGPQEVRDRRPGRGAVAGGSGRDRRPVRLDARDQRRLFLRRALFRHPRGAEGAEAARNPARLRQQNDEALVRELWRYPDDYPRERLLTPRRLRDLAGELDRQAGQHRLDRRGAGLRPRRLPVHRRPPGGARARPPGPAGGGDPGRRPVRPAPRPAHRPPAAGSACHRRAPRCARTW